MIVYNLLRKTYNKRNRLVLEHQTVLCNSPSKGDSLIRDKNNHLILAYQAMGGYFLFGNDRIAMIKAPNEIIRTIASYAVIGNTPFLLKGVSHQHEKPYALT